MSLSVVTKVRPWRFISYITRFLTYTKMYLKLLHSSAFVCLAIIASGFVAKTPFFEDPCAQVRASVKLSKDISASNTATVEVTGARQPIRYVFSDSKKEVVSTNYSSPSVGSLKPGKYTCLVREAGGCRKLIEFEVK